MPSSVAGRSLFNHPLKKNYFERDSASGGGAVQRERERGRESQVGSTLSVQSLTQGLNS